LTSLTTNNIIFPKEAVSSMTNEELNAISELLDAKLKPINNRLDRIDSRLDETDSRLDKVDTQFAEVKEQLNNIDTAIGMLADWADNVGVITRVPFASGQK